MIEPNAMLFAMYFAKDILNVLFLKQLLSLINANKIAGMK